MNPSPLLTIEIPKYVLRVKLSKARRKMYYTRGMKIPKKYINCGFNRKGFLVDKNGNPIVKNSRSAGKPRYLKLSGNWIISNQSTHVRRKAISELKAFYVRKLGEMDLGPLPEDAYPLRIEWDIYAPIGKADWDVDNLYFYWKYFCDALRNESILAEDNVRFITLPPAPCFIPVESDDERKFVFRFYTDDRECIQNHAFYREAVASS